MLWRPPRPRISAVAFQIGGNKERHLLLSALEKYPSGAVSQSFGRVGYHFTSQVLQGE